MSNLILLALIVLAVNIPICVIAYNCGYKARSLEFQSENDASYDKGRDDGYAEGYKCGFTKGREIGQEEALRSTELPFANEKNIHQKK